MTYFKKHAIAVVLAVVMGMAPFVTVEMAEARPVLDGQQTVADRQWKYVFQDGVVTIMGYVEKPSGDLVIPSELDGYAVTGIGDYAFSYCEELISVMLPERVTSIGDCAFMGCTGLTGVILPDGLTSIGWAAFNTCSSLTNVVIPGGVTSIEDLTFKYCTSLTEMTFPEGLKVIGAESFWGCASLTSVTIPESVNVICSYAFGICPNLANINIPDSRAHLINMETFSLGDPTGW